MKYKKGISTLSLVVVIVVVGIITSTVVITGSNLVAKAELKKFGAEMLQVKEAVERYKIRRNGNLDFETRSIGIYTAEQITQYSGEIIKTSVVNSDYTELYLIDLTKIDVENVNYANSINLYYYSGTTGKIYYPDGYRYKKTTVYYTLTDELMELIK